MHGLHLVVLDTDLLSHNWSFKADKSFKSPEYKHILDYLNSLSIASKKEIEPESLTKRIYNAMSTIQKK